MLLARSRSIFVVVGLLFGASSALSENKCANPDSQATATECSCLSYSSEDKKLNASYKLAMGRLTASERVKLRDGQRVWLKNLEPSCKEPLGPPELAGSMWRMELCDCLAGASKKRAALLRSWTGQESGSKSK